MVFIPSQTGYTHGSTGTKPATARNYANGDTLDADEFDFYVYEPFTTIDDIIAYLNAVDSNEDGVVDKADVATTANDTTAYKGNDIDTNGDGVVDKADDANTLNGQTASELSGGGGGFTLSGFALDVDTAHPLARFASLSSATLAITKYTLANETFASPSGLSIIVYDHTNGIELARYTGTSDTSLSTSLDISGIDVGVYVDNGDATFGHTGTGATQNVTASLNAQLK